MSGIRVGRRVEFSSTYTKSHVFRGELVTVLGEGFYGLVRDHSSRPPRLVRMDRLHPVGWYGPTPATPEVA